MSRKLIVLGAGASIGSKRFPIKSSMMQMRDRMPSAENFFYDLFHMNETDDREAGSLNYLGLTFEGLNDLITQAWNINKDGFNPQEWRGVNIEEVMTFFEVGARMFPEGSDEAKMFEKANKCLLSFMNPLIPLIYEDQHCEYLAEIFIALDKKDSILSYNWDTIAEKTLEKYKLIQLKNYAKLMRSDNIVPSQYRDIGIVLKMHGSFDWMICENPSCELYNTIQPPFRKNRYQLLTLHETWKCPSCGKNNGKAHIVPPVSDKTIHKNSFLRDSWMIAREKLINVEELVFIGYSFPPTDYYTEWLFRQLNFVEGGNECKVVVVNPDYEDESSLVYQRYNRLFKGHEIESSSTLKDYVKAGGYRS